LKISLLRQIGRIIAFLVTSYLLFFFHKTAFSEALPAKRYHLVKKVVLGQEGAWDYLTLDTKARRLYITRFSRVIVLNVDTGEIVGEVPNTAGVHGVTIVPDLGRGFTSDGQASRVTIFNLKTLGILGQVKTQLNPDAIVYDPFSGSVFTFNGKSNSATVFNAKTAKVLGNIMLGGKPEFAVSDGLGQVYVNLEDKSQLLTLDAKSLKVKAQWSLAPCSEPTGLAIDKYHRRLFVGCRNQMMAVVNADSGKITATLPIDSGTDATAFDPITGLVFSSNGSGSLTVIHEDSPDKFTIVDKVVTQRGARTMALDLKTHNVYLVTANFKPTSNLTKTQPFHRPDIVPNTFVVLVYGY
jgi:DNA-binding beta-propeller fold protein YncE